MKIITKNDIAFTKSPLPYGWMGNMCEFYEKTPLTIEYDERTWKCSESLFQALRFGKENINVYSRIWRAKNGFAAKIEKNKALKDGHKMIINPCVKEDFFNMVLVVKLKLVQHPILIDQLIKTGDCLIVEDVTARSTGNNLFWGASKVANKYWIGENVLGRIFMRYRDYLKDGISIDGIDIKYFII